MTANKPTRLSRNQAFNIGRTIAGWQQMRLAQEVADPVSPFVFAIGLVGEVVKFDNERQRLRIYTQVPLHPGDQVGVRPFSWIADGTHFDLLMTETAHEKAAVALGTLSMPDPAYAMFKQWRDCLGAALPAAAALFGSRIAVGEIGTHYDKALRGAKRVVLDWPTTRGEVVMFTAPEVIRAIRREVYEVCRRWEFLLPPHNNAGQQRAA